MKCPKCQTDNREGAKFCGKCRTKLSLICPQCDSENPPENAFCDQCGFDLKAPKESPPIDFEEPQSYTPKYLADKILNTRNAIEGERKLVTVLFADVANYTAMAEKLDPEEVHQIMDGCFKILMDEIHKYEGTINQFTGDGVMALFGAPVAHEDHAQRACHAALSIQKAIGDYNEKVNKDCGADFQMRIGINSGQVIVGSIGDDLRMDYTAVGDTTNLASRMESMAGPGTIYVSVNTQKLTRDFFEFKSLGKVEVKGKEDPREAFELIKTGEVETRIGASVAKGLTRFVGRKNSMAALMNALDRVKSGSGQVVGIVGEAGVGKSRLLLEMRSMLAPGEFRYLEGRCLQYGGSMIYLPVLDILRSYFEIKEGDREFIIKKKMAGKILDLDEKLKGVLSPFQELLSLKVDDEGFTKLEPMEKRERAFEAVRDLLIRVSQEKPLVLAVEDLHWIDKTSQEFLGYLIGWLANARILLILLYRPEYTHQWGSKSYYTKVGLDHLGTSSSSELIQAILEEEQVAPEITQLILNRAAGNPLFMEEFTHTLLENRSIERKDKEYVLSRKVADIQVPDTIQGIIAARMDRLEDNLKRTMQIASVIGRDFAFRILQTITGMREELKAYLINLQGLELIYEKRLFPELEYIFKHALTQEVAYNSLLHKRRKEIHENIGKAIEEIYAERLEEFYEMLAYHYSKSENTQKAFLYLKLAGTKAMQSHSISEASRFYKQACGILDRFPRTEESEKEKLELLHMMTASMSILGFPKDSLQFLQEGERLSKKLGDSKSLAIFYAMLGAYYRYAGQYVLERQFAEKGLEIAKELDDVELLSRTSFNACSVYMIAGEWEKEIDVASTAISLMERTETESAFFDRGMNVYSMLCGFMGMALGILGKFEDGILFCKKGLKNAAQIDDLITLGPLEFHFSSILWAKGDWDQAVVHLQKSVNYLEETKVILILSQALSALGYVTSFVGDLEAARRYVDKGLKMQTDAGIEVFLPLHYILSCQVYLNMGDLDKALDHIQTALDLSKKNKEIFPRGLSFVDLGRATGKKDLAKWNKAEDFLREGIHILEAQKAKAWYSRGYLYLGELYADIGQENKAVETLKKAERMFQEMGMDYWLAKTREILKRL